ncbi:Transcriptional regulator PadR-like family protein [Arthrobacter alpinus]|uniref:Transcriptional regulator PadR-like family protein n=1 Tax=Arthrobacter alpinus TaxID=656366 RepID=A0A1H5MBR2_9MICC|nr:helix-turn-helix transcriptional regulator [Arthrobacter alpinus]SEE86603.1 Transcriptional regulator PadR-like family protein [Arthrobacter alpinus]
MRELTRAAVRLLILHHAAEEDIHGAWMSEELSNHGYSISPGTLYPTLHRMEEQGLLSSRRRSLTGDRAESTEPHHKASKHWPKAAWPLLN